MNHEQENPQETEEFREQLDSKPYPPSGELVWTYSLPLVYELMMEAEDGVGGSSFRIPIELEPGSFATVTLIPKPDQNIVTIRVRNSTYTTRYS